MNTTDITQHNPGFSADEKAIVEVVRMNKAFPPKQVRKVWQIASLRITFTWRDKNSLWGRFGGGWNWKVGFQAGGSTVIIDLLVFSLRISREKAA